MAQVTIASGSTYTLAQTLTNGTNVEFLNNSGNDGVLILPNGALGITTATVNGTLTTAAYLDLGGTVLNFQPDPPDGYLGDQIYLQVIKSLFSSLDVATTAASDNASFASDITTASEGGIQFLIFPNGTVRPVVDAPFTLDANTQLIIDEMAQALFGTAAAAQGATLDLAFAQRTNPNSNHPFIDGVMTTQVPVNPCFCAGTNILTSHGEIPVEQLQIGDTLITQAGADQKIIWIGRRAIDIANHAKPEIIRPIIIEAGALADGVPSRRLSLSPDHALLLDGVLVPVKDLQNWTTIRPDYDARTVAYYHLELARHDVIFANAAPAESFLDTGHRGIFDNAASPIRVHPAVMQQRRATASCAPLCLYGPTLAAIRQRLAARQVGIRLRSAK